MLRRERVVNLAIASGKGGTGKTTVSAALAFSVNTPVRLLDCDVEAPNSHFFIQAKIHSVEKIYSLVPQVDAEKCTGCGECGQICQFSAIIVLGKKTLVFPELCHSCGGCTRICPTDAITEIEKEIGTIDIGAHGEIEFVSGRMAVGNAMSPPIIRAVRQYEDKKGLTIIDCPPGTSCPFITAVKGCDAVVLVAEPTPFGLHDLKLAVDTVRELKIPFGVIVNRSITEENCISQYCLEESIPLFLQIPEDRRVAEAYSRGEILIAVLPELRAAFAQLPDQLAKLSL